MGISIAALVSDPQSEVVHTHWCVVYAPKGRNRKRIPETCVTVCADEASTRAQADPVNGRYAAVASGPSLSSEGLRLYYLIRWLDEA